MDYIILNDKNLTEEQLLEAIKHNSRTAKLMRQEIEKLKQATEEYQYDKQIQDEEKSISNNEEELVDFPKQNLDFENEVDYYFSLLDSIMLSDNIKEKINDVMPSKKKPNYNKLIMRIQMEFLKNIKDINDLLEEERDVVSIEDLEDFKREIDLNRKKIEIINILSKEEKNTDEENIENNLFFVPTTGGNIRVFEEIDSIDTEYLATFKGLFDSIKDGTFKNVKRLSGSSIMTGISEVKDYKTRIVFDRIGKHDYAIISVFMKKSDNDKGYRVSLELKIKNYLNMKEKMLSCMKKEEFRNEHYLLEHDLYDKLCQNEKQLRKES